MIEQRKFWKDSSSKPFTMIITPMNDFKGLGYSSAGLTNGFTSIIANNNDVTIDDLIYFFNHETLHYWIGTSIKNKNEEKEYWFSEGFNEYINFKTISNGIRKNNNEYFLQKINQVIVELSVLPTKNIKNSEISYNNFWNDRNYERIPYLRGVLFAFFLELKIKNQKNH